MSNEVDRPEFWGERYREGRTGWDLGQPSPNLQRLTDEYVPRGARVLVPGCGRGHDVCALAGKGLAVTGLDFAPEAIEAARALASQKGVEAEWVVGDLFAERPEWHASFDAWVELTCFCAIDPARRADYVRQCAQWLKPGGVFIGVFFVGLPPGGPPYDSVPDDIRSLFAADFELLRFEPSRHSLPGREGLEWEGVFRRK